MRALPPWQGLCRRYCVRVLKAHHAMQHPRIFLLISSASLALGCTVAALSFNPSKALPGQEAGVTAGFMFFSTMAAAAGALTLATGTDALANRD